MNPLAAAEAGRAILAMGNEALARGGLEAGLGYFSTYPGTPASEVGTVLQELRTAFPGLYAEISTNEHVAALGAMGASWAGVRSMVAMKHVGMNVAAEPFHFAGYTGVRAGMVVVLGSDPGATSSTGEQDDRWYSLHTHLPVLEPADIQEAKEMTRRAFELSEAYDLPFVVNAPSKLCHNIGTLRLGPLPERVTYRGRFERNPERFLNLFDFAVKNHGRCLANVERLRADAASLGLNRVIPGSGRVGLVCSGLLFAYAMEALEILGLRDVPVLKVGMSYPLDPGVVTRFLAGLDRVVFVEELEGFLEFQAKRWAYDAGVRTPIVGKELFPAAGEIDVDRVVDGLAEALGRPVPASRTKGAEAWRAVAAEVPPRQGAFCPGCPHRGTNYALKRAAGPDTVFAGDIGCYTLSVLPPFRVSDWVTCMNCGAGSGQAVAQVTDQPVVALVGDSTFFHSGVPTLLNAVQNGADLVLLILDNRWVAMTGHQPSPTTDRLVDGTPRKAVDLVGFVRSLGVEWVRRADAFRVRPLEVLLREALSGSGVRVIVVEGECALQAERRRKLAPPAAEEWVDLDPERCQRCHRCYRELACPAIREEETPDGPVYLIDPGLCQRCGVCEEICPNSAITTTRIRRKGAA
ncbi:MAG: indolepyruvate ferredoxin oxidoreductase subunit alpha [Candidatus Dadabacteria bacterium]|nr:MAG: indolepyruvate ferredoxin oxidoreductase subunit alpha [Candidatus Dadabacteria bacterium]